MPASGGQVRERGGSADQMPFGGSTCPSFIDAQLLVSAFSPRSAIRRLLKLFLKDGLRLPRDATKLRVGDAVS